jgi:hypothetical protein
MIEFEKVIFRGQADLTTYYIGPTLLEESSLDSVFMQDEIFGPLLPILTYENETEIDAVISRYEKSLALCVFTKNHAFCEKLIQNYSCGGGCINDTLVHFSNKRLPFGGVGHSGIDAYHITYCIFLVYIRVLFGIGYCPFTDWHWKVREVLGYADRSNSYIHFLVLKITGADLPENWVDTTTITVFLTAFSISLYFALKKKKWRPK